MKSVAKFIVMRKLTKNMLIITRGVSLKTNKNSLKKEFEKLISQWNLLVVLQQYIGLVSNWLTHHYQLTIE